MTFRQRFFVQGVINSIIYDTGLVSTQTEKKRLLNISLIANLTLDNDIQGYHERAKVFDIPDRLIDVEANAFTTDLAKPGARINEIEVGLDIPVGETFKVAVKSGAAASAIYGTYNYEIIAG
jgi:hypothetical protein